MLCGILQPLTLPHPYPAHPFYLFLQFVIILLIIWQYILYVLKDYIFTLTLIFFFLGLEKISKSSFGEEKVISSSPS